MNYSRAVLFLFCVLISSSCGSQTSNKSSSLNVLDGNSQATTNANSKISRWTADFNQTQLAGGKSSSHHIDYDEGSGEVLIVSQISDQNSKIPATSTLTLSSENSRNKIDSALSEIDFNNLSGSYQSSTLWSDTVSVDFVFYTSDQNKSVVIPVPDAGPPAIQILYSVATSLNFEE